MKGGWKPGDEAWLLSDVAHGVCFAASDRQKTFACFHVSRVVTLVVCWLSINSRGGFCCLN